MVVVGLTVTFGFVPNPYDQINVVPVISELTVKSELSPRQISTGFAIAVICGNGFTVSVSSDVPLLHSNVVPVTEYVVVVVGETVTDDNYPRQTAQVKVLDVI